MSHILILIAVCVLTGCASGDMLGNKISVKSVSGLLLPDSSGNVNVDISFDIPGNYFSKRSRLVIVPQFIVGGRVEKECNPLVVEAPVYARKIKRKEVIEKFNDPYIKYKSVVDNTEKGFELEYNDKISVPEGIDLGEIRAVVTTDGCGECTGFDTVHVAYVKEEMKADYVMKTKILEGKGSALLRFVINKHDINLGLGNNRKELYEMVDRLLPVFSDSLACVDSITIYGLASADGPYGFNKKLAKNRAEAAKEWLIKTLDIKPELQRVIFTASRPEGWWPVYKAMVDDGHPDSVKVKHILTLYADCDDDVQERYIRRLSCWKDIREKYLPSDRKVDYTYRYTVRSYTTDGELLSMYSVKPEALDENEMLRVAQLVDGDKAKSEVYRKVLSYFPGSVVAANNLVLICLRNDKVDEAMEIIRKYPGNFSSAGKMIRNKYGEVPLGKYLDGN